MTEPSETAAPLLPLPEILRIIREEAAVLELTQVREQQVAMRQQKPSAARDEQWPSSELSDLCRIPAADVYRVTDFLVLDDVSFVENAYRIMLKREADPIGTAAYLSALRNGALRQDLLCDLAASEEGQRAGARVGGLRIFRMLRQYVESRRGGRLVSAPIKRMVGFAQTVQAFVAHSRKTVNLTLWLLKYQSAHEAYRHNIRLQHERLQATDAALGEAQQKLASQMDAVTREMAAHRIDRMRLVMKTGSQDARETRSGAVPPVSGEVSTLEDAASAAIVYTPADEIDRFYFHFEEACRGPQDEILQRLSRYLPYMPQEGSRRVVDMGCGRGEWLSVLKEAGFDAVGLDINPVMVAICQGKGLQARCEDVIAYLRAQPENSHAAVTGFHVAEHVPLDLLLALVRESHRVLQPGGVLVLETPNPENVLVGSHTFYHDPTHRNPLTPTFMQFLAEYHGYASHEILRLNPYPDSARVVGYDALTERVNGHFCGYQDFALLARKGA